MPLDWRGREPSLYCRSWLRGGSRQRKNPEKRLENNMVLRGKQHDNSLVE